MQAGLIGSLLLAFLVAGPACADVAYVSNEADNTISIIDLAQMKDEKFVALNEGFVTSQSFFQAFERGGLQPQIAMEVSDIFSLINLVSEGMGYGLLPGRIGAFSSRIQLIPLTPKYASQQSIALIFSRSRERDPNLLALAAECRMYARADMQKQNPSHPDASCK